MSEKKVYNSFEDFGVDYFEENEELIEKQKLLLSCGVKLSLDDIENIDVFAAGPNHEISYFDKRTNQIVTSDIFGRVFEKWSNSIRSNSLTFSNLDNNLFEQHFYGIDSSKSHKKIIDGIVLSRSHPKFKLLSRAYRDISTKYGDFCLHVEEGYTDYKWGPYRLVSLYFGNHNNTMVPYKNDFDFCEFCLFRWKFEKNNNFSRWNMGYYPSKFTNPKMNTWYYPETIVDGKSSGIFASSDRVNNDHALILLNGSLKVTDNLKYCPEFFGYFSDIKREIKEYEDEAYDSKAYFCNPSDLIAILKKDNKIMIEHKHADISTREWGKVFSGNITSTSEGIFTPDDFLSVWKILTHMQLHESEKAKKFINASGKFNRLKDFALNQISTYADIFDHDDFNTLDKFSLENVSFDDMLNVLKSPDIVQIVETGLETMMENFHISIEDLLGNNPPNQKEGFSYVKSKNGN